MLTGIFALRVTVTRQLTNLPMKSSQESGITAQSVKGCSPAGYDYNVVQKRVNEKLYKKTVDEIAVEVIVGLWGNGAERKERLTNAGYDYSEVQERVNQIIK